jgi:peptidoglycan/xylan/chitin deacetylase (PgdA/CDA1 family)
LPPLRYKVSRRAAPALQLKTENCKKVRLGLKIDVDTLAGLREGAPALAGVLNQRGIRASFFVALGPDNSGRAVLRVFRQQGFLAKMLRTRAPAVYGWKTMLYGTLLPAPVIGKFAADILPDIVKAGHELGLHGYDHVRWHDRLLQMTPAAVNNEVNQAQEVFRRLVGHPARAFAAPGWQASAVSRAVLAEAGFVYASDTRGRAPYWPRFGTQVTRLLEIPTTLPTLDELWGMNGMTAADFFQLILARLSTAEPQVFTLHAELEGGPCLAEFARFLDDALAWGVEFFTLEEWAAEILQHPQEAPIAEVYQGRLPGRAGTVSRQADEGAP